MNSVLIKLWTSSNFWQFRTIFPHSNHWKPQKTKGENMGFNYKQAEETDELAPGTTEY